MTTFLATVASGAALLSLLAGCAAHLSRPAGLPEALRAHRTLPHAAVRVATVAVPGSEGLLGIAGIAALLTGSRAALALVLGAGTLLFGTYALYVRHVLATGRGGPCGCARTELPMSGWITARATALAVLAATGAVLTGPAQAAFPADGAHLGAAALAALTFALLLWTLPAALYDPSAPPGDHAGSPATGTTGGPQWISRPAP